MGDSKNLDDESVAVAADLAAHEADTSNPHVVTQTQVGLGNVDDTSDADKPVSTAQQTALDLKEDKANKGDVNGYAPLDANQKVPAENLPNELMHFKGNWNAATNSPTLANTDTDVQGFTYRVSAPGTVDFGAGNITFAVGDWVFNNGIIWDKGDNTDEVASVFGRIGTISAQNGDYTPGEVIDGASIPTATLSPTDKVIIQDVDDSKKVKTVEAQDIANLASMGAFASLQATPSDPSGTASSTGVMMGLAQSFTPTNTGKVSVTVSGWFKQSSSLGTAGVVLRQIRYGTGSAPSNGASLTGTAVGGQPQMGVDHDGFTPFSSTVIITGLTPSTAYWFDIGLARVSSGTATCGGLGVAIAELI